MAVAMRLPTGTLLQCHLLMAKVWVTYITHTASAVGCTQLHWLCKYARMHSADEATHAALLECYHAKHRMQNPPKCHKVTSHKVQCKLGWLIYVLRCMQHSGM
jgi:hypothetical protein